MRLSRHEVRLLVGLLLKESKKNDAWIVEGLLNRFLVSTELRKELNDLSPKIVQEIQRRQEQPALVPLIRTMSMPYQGGSDA